jgi:hypothetical protein
MSFRTRRIWYARALDTNPKGYVTRPCTIPYKTRYR